MTKNAQPSPKAPDAGAVSAILRWLREAGHVLRTHGLWFAAAIALAGIVLLGVVLVAIAFAPNLGELQRELIAQSSASSRGGAAVLFIAAGLPAVIASFFVAAMCGGTIAGLARDAVAHRETRFWANVARGIRRSPVIVAAVTLVVLATVALSLLTPVLVVVGVLGLVTYPLLRLAARRWTVLAAITLPRVLILAIPFAAVAVVLTRWSLVLPAAALKQGGPLAALQSSERAVKGRTGRVLVVLVTTLAILVAVQVAVGFLSATPVPLLVVSLLVGLVQLALGAAPTVMGVVLLEELAPGGDLVDPAPGRLLRHRVALTASAVTLSLLAVAMVPGTSAAFAAGAPGLTVSWTANPIEDGDQVDITIELRDADGALVTGTGSVILRGLPDIYERGFDDGTVTITTRSLSAGTYSVYAEHPDGDSTPVVLTVSPRGSGKIATTTTLSPSAGTALVGEVLPVTVAVTSGAPGGTVPDVVDLAIDGGTSRPAVLNGGQYEWNVDTSIAGTHTITATFAGSASHDPSSATASYTVSKHVTQPTLTVTPTTSRLGSPVVITASLSAAPGVPNPTGTVDLMVEGLHYVGLPLVNGIASLDYTPAAVGTFDVTLAYDGDSFYAGIADHTITHTVVARNATTIDVSTSAGPYAFRAPLTLSARVEAASGTPTGDVYFSVTYENVGGSYSACNATIANGVASCDFAPFYSGSVEFVASYAGDADNGQSQSAVTVQVEKAITTTALVVSGSPWHGADQTLIMSVLRSGGSFADGGTLRLTIDGVATILSVNSSGQVTYTASGLAIGEHTFFAEYLGGDHDGLSAATVKHIIAGWPTSVNITSSMNPAVAGTPVTFTVTVVDNEGGSTPPEGQVVVTGGGLNETLTLVGGTASFTSSVLAVGVTTLRAHYSSQGHYADATKTLEQDVRAASTTTTVNAGGGAVVSGELFLISAEVTSPDGIPTGLVEFSIDGDVVGSANLASGVAETTVRAPMANATDSAGRLHFVRAVYKGTAVYAGSIGDSSKQVGKGSVTLSASDDTGGKQEYRKTFALNLAATVVAPGGGPATGTFRATDSVTSVTAPAVNGAATLAIPISWIGVRDFTVTFVSGDFIATPITYTVTGEPFTPEVTLAVGPTEASFGDTITMSGSFTIPARFLEWPSLPGYSGQLDILSGTTVVASAMISGNGQGLVQPYSFTTRDLPVGTHDLTARFTPTGGSAATASSTPVRVTVAPLGTEVIRPAADHVLVGVDQTLTLPVATHGWSTSNPRPLAGGTVELYEGATLLGTATLGNPFAGHTFAKFPFSPALSKGVHHLTAKYLGSSTHAASSLDFDYSIVESRTRIDLRVGDGAGAANYTWGQDVPFTASASIIDAATGPQPSGVVTIMDADDDTNKCSVPVAGGTCNLRWALAGVKTVKATYVGDGIFGGSTESASVTVQRKDPGLVVTTSSLTPVTGDIFKLHWKLNSGPLTASVLVGQVADGNACLSTTVGGGNCEIVFGLATDSTHVPLYVSYPGDSQWLPASWSAEAVPVGCYPLGLSVDPAGAGKIVAEVSPNCGGGTGYLRGTAVSVRATPLPSGTPEFSWRFRSLLPAGSTTEQSMIKIGPNSVPGLTTYAFAQFEPVYACVTVRLESALVQGVAADFLSPTVPNCPVASEKYAVGKWSGGTGYVEARFLPGSSITTRSDIYGKETTQYGIRWNGNTAIVQPTSKSFVADRDVTVGAVFGPVCYGVNIATTGPGSVSTTTPPNCFDPRRSSPGWRAYTDVGLKAKDAFFGAYIEGWKGAAWNSDPTADFLERWQATVTMLPETPQNTMQVSAFFAQCWKLTFSPEMDISARGAAEALTPPDCPLGAWTKMYANGSEVKVKATPVPEFTYKWEDPNTGKMRERQSYSKFGHWQLGDRQNAMAERTVIMDQDRQLKPTFWSQDYKGVSTCPTLTAGVEPGSSALVQVDTTHTSAFTSYCNPGNLTGGYASFLEGAFRVYWDSATLDLDAKATKGDPLLGWRVHLKTPGVWAEKTVTSPGAHLELNGLTHHVRVTAVACQGIDPIVALTNDRGETVTSPMPEDGYLIMTSPAPNCPYANDAWLVGTKVELAALADPRGYAFTGWGEAASGTQLTTTVVMEGDTKLKKIQAAYTTTCFQLTLTHDYKQVTKYPEPNCPGYPASENRYTGGTKISLYGKVPGGKVWQGWVGDVAPTGKANPVYLEMDSDKTAGHRWRSKNVDEKINGAFNEAGDWIVQAAKDTGAALEDFGDGVAIAAKKTVAVMALIATEMLPYLPPIGVITLVAAAGDLIGTALDAMGVDNDIVGALKGAQQLVDYFMSGLSCATVWGFNGNGSTNFLAQSSGSGSENDFINAANDAKGVGSQVVNGQLTSGDDIHNLLSGSLNSVTTAKGTYDTINDSYELVNNARTSFYKTARNALTSVDDISSKAVGLGAAINVADIVLSGGFGIDSSAKAAWTDGDAYWQCMLDKIPPFMGPGRG